ncbi:DUF998 domain-containing protein [Burkholderia sp. AU45388]|uniref:DUF998 domain-containing protein n=1 Tax=Burkholderia sp. AU45388 TaxID=3059206 RepID=UPI002656B1CB|nr:DUF998 domain-containing protein [Burkholderia sp. AU45388]MDN7430766.1 DUF998 domain-containing protein [Burkholderia sp. AU45388]
MSIQKSPQDRLTSRLLSAGLIAGPLVITVGFAQAILRDGFDLRHHASSQLALGEFGWVQSLNFIVAGLLMLAFAIGARRVLKGTPGGLWAPLLLAVFAVSHVLVGLFRTDPAFGFPPGVDTPPGLPAYDQATTHAILHALFGSVGFMALTAASFVLAWHFGQRHRAWMMASLIVAAIIIGIAIYGGLWESQHVDPVMRSTAHFDFLPMWATLPLIWGYLTALAWRLRR